MAMRVAAIARCEYLEHVGEWGYRSSWQRSSSEARSTPDRSRLRDTYKLCFRLPPNLRPVPTPRSLLLALYPRSFSTLEPPIASRPLLAFLLFSSPSAPFSRQPACNRSSLLSISLLQHSHGPAVPAPTPPNYLLFIPLIARSPTPITLYPLPHPSDPRVAPPRL